MLQLYCTIVVVHIPLLFVKVDFIFYSAVIFSVSQSKYVFVVPLEQSPQRRILRHGGHKHGILRDFSKHGKFMELSGNSVQPQGKIITNKTVLIGSNICVKKLLTV